LGLEKLSGMHNRIDPALFFYDTLVGDYKMVKEQITLVTGKYIILAYVYFSSRSAKKYLKSYQDKFPHADVEQKADVIMVKYIL
jgi:hypothetical protein